MSSDVSARIHARDGRGGGLREILAARKREIIEDRSARRAAVLVPIVADGDRLQLLFFERTRDVIDHKGEICFPGGAIQPNDAGPVGAALREASEELGLRADHIEILGELDDVHTTVSNYVITPVIGYFGAMPELFLDPLEVARPIIVALDDLLSPGHEQTEFTEHGGTMRMHYWYGVEEGRIWGATGRIVHGLLEVLRSR